jgi:hypothetical protein
MGRSHSNARQGPGISVRERVFEVLANWAGVGFDAVLPESQTIAAIWSRNPANSAPGDENLSILIRNLDDAFPQARLDLAPGDLAGSGETAGKLGDYVEARA